jgi:AcrR family transcriptional regulator
MVDDGDVSPGGGGEGPRVVEPRGERVSRRDSTARRDAIVDAMVEVIAECGYAGASVELVCARAKVSRRRFHECFESFEDCFLAILGRGLEAMTRVMSQALAGEGDWLDRLLAVEAAVLVYLDSEPQLAWVLMVEALGAGSWAFERRQQHVEALRELIVERFGIRRWAAIFRRWRRWG